MTSVTPEHLQLLSDKKLQQAVEDESISTEDVALARAARYELKRRQCEVPVSDRYTSKSAPAAS